MSTGDIADEDGPSFLKTALVLGAVGGLTLSLVRAADAQGT